jgi:purine-binding chemotaxis protein CheW
MKIGRVGSVMSASLNSYLDEIVSADELSRNAEAYRQREAQERLGQQLELVVFGLDAHWLALPLTAIREIAPARPPTRLPECPPAVLGLSNLRGTILLVLDLRPLLGYGPATGAAAQRLLVLEDRIGPTALAVDAVAGQARCDVEQFRPLAAGEVAGHHGLVRGVAPFKDQPLSWLDAERMFELFQTALR